MQAWSDKNRETGEPNVLRDWSVAMRKREQERVGKRKRQADSDRDDYYGIDDNDTAVVQGRAVPQWLLDKVGDGYNSDDILDIVRKINDGVVDGSITSIPDIEFLPHLVKDENKPKGTPKRKTPVKAGHARSQSMGLNRISRDHENYNMIPRRESDAIGHWERESGYGTPAEKRPRLSVPSLPYPNHEQLPSIAPRNTDRIVPTIQHMHRRQSVIDDVREAGGQYSNDRRGGSYNAIFSNGMMSSPGAVLPAPNSSATAQLAPLPETPPNNYNVRSSHQRSQSEAGSFAYTVPSSYRQATPGHNATSGGDYGYTSPAYQLSGSFSNANTPRYPAPYTPQSSFSYDQTPTREYGPAVKHMRHFSTPVALRPYGSDSSVMLTPPGGNYNSHNNNYMAGRSVAQQYAGAVLPRISQVNGYAHGEGQDVGRQSHN